jgi:hypothetical protein
MGVFRLVSAFPRLTLRIERDLSTPKEILVKRGRLGSVRLVKTHDQAEKA